MSRATAKINEAKLPRYRAVGELTSVIPNSGGAPKLVSVLVSVADPLTPNPLLHMQLEVEPMAGIGQRFPLPVVEMPYFIEVLKRNYG